MAITKKPQPDRQSVPAAAKDESVLSHSAMDVDAADELSSLSNGEHHLAPSDLALLEERILRDSADNSTTAPAATSDQRALVFSSEEEMETKLKQDIVFFKREAFVAVQKALFTDVSDPNYEEICASEASLNAKRDKAITAFKATFGREPHEVAKPQIPANLTTWQWDSKVFDRQKYVYRTPNDCVSDFENILKAHGQCIAKCWRACIISILPGPILAWYNRLLDQKPETTWESFKLAFVEHFGMNPIMQKEVALSSLLAMKYHDHEEIHEYIQRFNDLRVTANMQDMDTLKHCFTDPLPPNLFKEVEKDFRGKTLSPDEMADILSFHYSIYKKTNAKQEEHDKRNAAAIHSDRFKKHAFLDRRNKYDQKVSKHQRCIIHPKSMDHPTKECRTRISCMAKGICFRCFKAWSPTHKCQPSSKENYLKPKSNSKGKAREIGHKTPIVPMEVDDSSSSSDDSNLRFAAAKLDKIKQD